MALVVPVAHAAAAPSEVEITFPTSDGLALAGTLTLPDGPGPFAAAVLVGGFGPTNRDGGFGLLGRSDYDDWARRLARRGIAVLRYDKRGIGASFGPELAWLDPLPLTRDARAATRALAARREIDRSRIAIIGHSQGGTIALRAAVNSPASRLVLLSSPGRPLERLPEIAAPGARALLRAVVGRAAARRTLRLDPRRDAVRARQPVLIIHGLADRVVPARDALLLRNARRSAGGTTRVVFVPRADHYLVVGDRTPERVVTQIASAIRR